MVRLDGTLANEQLNRSMTGTVSCIISYSCDTYNRLHVIWVLRGIGKAPANEERPRTFAVAICRVSARTLADAGPVGTAKKGDDDGPTTEQASKHRCREANADHRLQKMASTVMDGWFFDRDSGLVVDGFLFCVIYSTRR